MADLSRMGNEFLELESNISFNLDGVSYSGSGFAVDDEYVPYAKSEEKMPDIFPYIV